MLSVENLRVTARLRGGETAVLVDGLSLAVERGTRLAVVGQSGCGKTMTAMAILGLLPENCAAAGRVLWEGRDLLALPRRQRRDLLGRELVFIPQSGADFLSPSRRVGSQMRESLRRAGLRGERALRDILRRVGFDRPEEILSAYPFQLSGGMAQRVVMAMSALGQPGLVIADEPTRGVDRENAEHFLALMEELFARSAVVLITHDLSIAGTAGRILVMNGGRAVEAGETERVLRGLPRALSGVERGLCL